MNIPSWKLPPGVCRGTWDYLQSESIAKDYDDKLADSPLLQLDQRFIQDYLPKIQSAQLPPRIGDFGCGTGRISRLLSPLGYRMLNVDLSPTMLDVLKQNCKHPELNECVQANLVELECIEPESLQMALCLFSSIGMIQGRLNRQQFLRGVHRVLQPGSSLIVHVHNRYHSLWHPTGPSWLIKTWLKSRFDRTWEYGDRVFVDLGIPSMFLHIYSRRELVQDLRAGGYSNIKIVPINVPGNGLLSDHPLVSLRAGGFFAVAS